MDLIFSDTDDDLEVVVDGYAGDEAMEGSCDVFPPPERCDAFPPPYCDASSSTSRYCKVFYQHSGCCVFLLRHRMVQCVLSTTQAAEQAIIVQKVDQHDHPLPDDDVHAVEEAAHPHPPHRMMRAESFPALR